MSDPRFESLDDAFALAIGALSPRDPVTVLYSGGVDSSVVAHALRERPNVRLLSVGVDGASDLSAGRAGAHLLGMPWEGRLVMGEEAIEALGRHHLSEHPEPIRSVLASLALAIAATPASGTVAVGQGADELFGGYAHFRRLASADREQRRVEDWHRLMASDWPTTLEIATRVGRRLAAPFLDPEFARRALAVPLPAVGAGELTKPVFREWAVHRGVPPALADRPKRALQYGSGVAALLRRADRV